MTVFQDRPYQAEATAKSLDFIYNDYAHKSGIIAAPTGVGKAIIVARIVDAVTKEYPQARIAMFTHVKELVEQNYQRAASLSSVDIGLWHAGLRKKEYDRGVVFAGIDTVRGSVEKMGRRDIILIDECHRVAPNPKMTYRRVVDELRYYNPNLKIVGLTATPYRMGQGHLLNPWKKIPSFFDKMILDLTSPSEFKKFFDEGYLKRLVPKEPSNVIDVSGMRIKNDEYVQEDVEAVVNNAERIKSIVDEILDQGADRRSWLVFAAGNRNAELLREEICSRGIRAECLSEATPDAERTRIIDEYKAYNIRCLINNDILTTGFDHNGVDLIAVVRVTNSTPLWVQILGRGTRPVYAQGFDLNTTEGRLQAIFASGVYNCLVLDFAGNTARLGAINDPLIPKAPEEKKSSSGVAPVKICDRTDGGCGAYNAVTAFECEYCGKEFPINEDIKSEAGTRELIQEKEHVADIRRLAVTSISYTIVRSQFRGIETSKVVARYNCGKLGSYTEDLIFRGSDSTVKVRNWWEMFGSAWAIPTCNDYFMEHFSRNPERLSSLQCIDVYMNKPKRTKPEIEYYGFENTGHLYSDTQ